MRVSTNKYRFFLILLLVAALSGGLWYCYHMSDKGKAPEDGTLVYNQSNQSVMEADPNADHLS